MTELYVVIIEDRHDDTDCEIFASEEQAVEYAMEEARGLADSPSDIIEEQLEGWIYAVCCSTEGDYVRVVRKVLRGS